MVLYVIVLYCFVLQCIVWYGVVLYCIVLYVYCIVLYCMCCIVCVCMCLYVLVGRVAPQTRMLFCRTLYQNVPVLILLKINDMDPYGIHLITPHCISITLLLHYYTSESQHFLRVLTLFFASCQPASQSSQQASCATLVREYEGDTLVHQSDCMHQSDLEGDMQSALFLMQ